MSIKIMCLTNFSGGNDSCPRYDSNSFPLLHKLWVPHPINRLVLTDSKPCIHKAIHMLFKTCFATFNILDWVPLVDCSLLGLVRQVLTLLHPERPKLHTILAFLSAIGLIKRHTCTRLMLYGDKL